MQKCDYHIIQYENDYLLYFVNAFRLLKINKVCKNIFIDRFQKNYSVKDISRDYQISEKEIENFLEVIFRTQENTPPKIIEDYSDQATIKINVANACNLNCRYCYADYRLDRKIMNNETAGNVVDFLTNRLQAKELVITFFGGEPLLNVDVIEYLCEKLSKNKEKHITFSIITNATLISNKFIDLVKKYNIFIRFSIDGPKEVNDKLRVYRNGKGSYDRINKNVKKLISIFGKEKISYESTYTNVHEHNNCTRQDVKLFMKNEFGIDNGLILDCEDPVNLAPSKEEISKQFAADEAYINCVDNFINSRYKKYSCSTGTRHFTISANGELFPCHRFLGFKNMSMGDVSKINLDESMLLKSQAKLKELDKTKSKKCRNCWARMLCQYCPAAEMSRHGNFIACDDKCNEIKETSKNFIKSIYDITINKKSLS
ncbi:MAG: radical SAM protein [Candidatus Delongbacteria bacterium]|jgi:uncharacterized protein|nr:radical SAM protein [Candidatus Delongbacteria bacterium]